MVIRGQTWDAMRAERDELRAKLVTMRGVIQDLVHLAENEESASEEAWNEAWTNAQLVLGPRKERQNRIALDQDQ